MGCGMACSCRGGMKGSPRTRTVTPQQLAARRTGLGVVSAAPVATAPAPVAPLAMNAMPVATQTAAGMAAERRAAEKKRRDTLRNKLGR